MEATLLPISSRRQCFFVFIVDNKIVSQPPTQIVHLFPFTFPLEQEDELQARLKDNIRQFRDEQNDESGLGTEENLIFALFEDDDTAVPVVHISIASRDVTASYSRCLSQVFDVTVFLL